MKNHKTVSFGLLFELSLEVNADMSITTITINMSNEETAAMVGSIWVLMPSHIFFGRVVTDTPDINKVTTISSNDVTNANSAAEIIDGFIE